MIALAALALAQGMTPSPAPRPVEARLRGPEAWYLALIDRYRGGDRAGAIAAPLVPEKALLEVSALKRQAEAGRCISCTARERIEAFPFEVAVLLHTERAFERLETDDSAGPAELEIAPRLVALMPEERRRAFEPRWLRVVSQVLCRLAKWDLGLGLLQAARARYPGDPLLILAAGATLETKARFDPGTIHVESELMGRHDRTESAQRGQLVQAQKSYRQALALRPDLHQARLRLARVLQLLGRHEASMRELRMVTEAAPDPRTVYLARLFLGYAREASGQYEPAAAEYEQAVRAVPGGQAAAVALSHALHRSGRRRESVGVLQAGMAHAGRRAVVDPWWPYVLGEWEDPDALLGELRTEASR